ncbi:MAG: IS481 family transposase, partial [Dictyoglomaceae bacterium]|nr:IS481 family transposase [Dictyoglomaceae bacterium]
HKQDDEYFLGIHAERCGSKEEFLEKAQKCQDTWNVAISSFGIIMDSKTPYEKLISTIFLAHHHIFEFPMILRSIYLFIKNLSIFIKSGTYVHTKCRPILKTL